MKSDADAKGALPAGEAHVAGQRQRPAAACRRLHRATSDGRGGRGPDRRRPWRAWPGPAQPAFDYLEDTLVAPVMKAALREAVAGATATIHVEPEGFRMVVPRAQSAAIAGKITQGNFD
jgi:hypothetical protein